MIPKGENSLLDVFPEVVDVWNYERNYPLVPEQMLPKSNKKVWWKCSECGLEWQASIDSKIRYKHTTCRSCSAKKASNLKEYLRKGENDFLTCNPRAAKEWDYEKNTIRPESVTKASRKKVWWKCEKGHEWEATILSRSKGGFRGCPICANRKIVPGVNDLATVKPSLAKEWNYERNGDLKPCNVGLNSNKKVWWKCEKGHEWEVSANSRSGGNGCPVCSNKKIVPGVNDLATTNPSLAKEWNYERNGDLKPEQYSFGSSKKVWWKCEKGHEWEAIIANRATDHNRKCPICANRMVKPGENDLATVNPSLAKEWNYEKNGNLRPCDVVYGSPMKVWWKCEKGHEWEANIVSRNKGHFCPVCNANKQTSIAEKAIVFYLRKAGIVLEENKKIGRRELDIFIPELKVGIEYDGEYWHKDTEKDIIKNKICVDNGIKLLRVREPGLPELNDTSVDFRIKELLNDNSHLNEPISEIMEYLQVKYTFDIDVVRDLNQIYELFQKGEKKTSIAEEYPQLIEEWDYKKNSFTPEMVSKGQHLRVWWICKKCGFNWDAEIYSRCSGSGCPNCANRVGVKKPEKLKEGVNDLETVHPDIADSWDYKLNKDVTPKEVTCGSNVKYWWKCEKGHSWQASVSDRVQGRGCAICSGRVLLSGFNDLQTIKPEIAKEWNYEKNGNLRPTDVFPSSAKKVWWKCPICKKEWQSGLYTREKPLCGKCRRKKEQLKP